MPVTIVATVGASTSNCYVTLAEATAYFNNHPENSTWTGLADDDTRSRYLILATTYVDAENIYGDKNDTGATSGVPDQALKFPRSLDVDDGSEFIPAEVKRAVYEQALYMATAGSGSTRQDLQAQGVTEIELPDGLREKYGDGSGGSAKTLLCTRARHILMMAGVLDVGGQWGP